MFVCLPACMYYYMYLLLFDLMQLWSKRQIKIIVARRIVASIWTSFCCCESALSFFCGTKWGGGKTFVEGAFADLYFLILKLWRNDEQAVSANTAKQNCLSPPWQVPSDNHYTDCTQIISSLGTIGVWVFYTSDTMREGFQGLQWSNRWSSNEGFQSEVKFWQTLPTSPNLEVYISSAYSICLVDHEKAAMSISHSHLPTHIY